MREEDRIWAWIGEQVDGDPPYCCEHSWTKVCLCTAAVC